MRTKTRLNVLSLAEWDYAGVGYQLNLAINDSGENSSAAVRWQTSYIDYPYHHGRLDMKTIAKLWRLADVIHIHDGFFHLPGGLQGKPTLITYHGSMYRRASAKHNSICKANNWLMSVSTVDLMPLGPVLWMPDTRYPYKPKDKHGRFTVCHAPTSRPGKSTEVVIEACKLAGVPLELIEKSTWDKCLDRKSRCHLLVDQFKLGYGCNAIEAWAMGIPVIANADKSIKSRMSDTFQSLPFCVSDESPKALADMILRLRDDAMLYRQYQEAGMDHYDRWHSPQATAAIAGEYYHKAIELFYSRKPDAEIEVSHNATKGLPGRDGTALIRYIGGNIGTETYVGHVTKRRYDFSAADPLKYVDARDVPHLLSIRTKRERSRRPLFKEE